MLTGILNNRSKFRPPTPPLREKKQPHDVTHTKQLILALNCSRPVSLDRFPSHLFNNFGGMCSSWKSHIRSMASLYPVEHMLFYSFVSFS